MFKKRLVQGLIISILLNGCSAAMALKGKDTPSLSAVQAGNSRSQVEASLGAPFSTTDLGNGKTKRSYKYEVGSDPSVARAIGYVLLDIWFIFIPELITIPIETNIGEKRVAEITYDKNDKIIDMSFTTI